MVRQGPAKPLSPGSNPGVASRTQKKRDLAVPLFCFICDAVLFLVFAQRVHELLTETGHWHTRQLAQRMKARKTFELGPERWDEALRMIEATIAQARAAGDLDNATRAMLTQAVGEGLEVSFLYLDDIEHTNRGKHQFLIQEVPLPPE